MVAQTSKEGTWTNTSLSTSGGNYEWLWNHFHHSNQVFTSMPCNCKNTPLG